MPDIISRRHWSFDGKVLTILAARGQIVDSQAYLGSVSSELVAEPAIDLKRQLEGSIAYGHPGLTSVSYVGMDEFKAMHLYFEGALTIDALKKAAEDKKSIRVMISLNDKLVACLIRSNPPRPIMIVGTDGAMLPTPFKRAYAHPPA